MSVPSTVADLSATAALNSPSGSESIGTNLDDYLRAHAAIIRQVSDAKANSGANADITSLSGISGNLAFTGTGNRITGDFSNATIANRVMFQTSTVNSKTSLNAVPNGTGVGSEVVLFSNVDPSNSSYAAMTTDNTAMTVIAGKIGTGTYLPMTFYTSGSERLRIDTSGNVRLGAVGARITGDFSNATIANRVMFQTSTVNGVTSVGAIPNGTSVVAVVKAFGASDPTNAPSISISQLGATESRLSAEANGSSGYTPLTVYTGGSESMRIDTSGNVLVTNSGGGLGYGIGSGGGVNQATSKSTAVTLNKPSGQISMNNAALASGASVTFVVNNSFVTLTDGVNVWPVANGSYVVTVTGIFSGQFQVRVTNITGGSLSEALPINFQIAKGATT